MASKTITIKHAKTVTGGGITAVTKMPCHTYNIPAAACGVGGKLRAEGLRQIKLYGKTDITCGYCYAHKGQFTFPGVPEAQARRLASIYHPHWVDAMVVLIRKQSKRYFRWHSSGDIQSLDHLIRIVAVCLATPETSHWLPTQERRIVAEYLKRYGSFPSNLCVRISAVKLAGHIGAYRGDTDRQASMVSETPVDGAHNCPAPHQGNNCGDCRACWDKATPLVVYHLH